MYLSLNDYCLDLINLELLNAQQNPLLFANSALTWGIAMESDMNLLNGFKMRSENKGQAFALRELNDLSFSGSDLSGEPGLAEMLADPVILSLMLRDGVRPDDVDRLFKMKQKIAA